MARLALGVAAQPGMTIRVLTGDCRDVLPTLEPASVHAVVTDPPAGISFMNTEWDHGRGGRAAWCAWMQEIAAECLRVIKPGGHALVWSIPRTSHWTATAWEDAGWQVRDRLCHLFASGFPKSLDVSKALDRMAGAEREIVGPGQRHNSARCSFAHGDTKRLAGRRSSDYRSRHRPCPAMGRLGHGAQAGR